jgi:hypothetical protein
MRPAKFGIAVLCTQAGRGRAAPPPPPPIKSSPISLLSHLQKVLHHTEGDAPNLSSVSSFSELHTRSPPTGCEAKILQHQNHRCFSQPCTEDQHRYFSPVSPDRGRAHLGGTGPLRCHIATVVHELPETAVEFFGLPHLHRHRSAPPTSPGQK